MAILGIDTGGTFTDFVLVSNGEVRLHKLLSTPANPEQAILQGVRDLLGVERAQRIVHGSTVATNAVLEGKGARVAMVFNEGFADLLTIGRQARAELYNLQPQQVPPPVPAELCLEAATRCDADGQVVRNMTDDELEELVAKVDALDVQAVAINLLFSYLSDGEEKRIADALGKSGRFVCRSSEVLPEMREYERGIATWLNARVGPVMSGYLSRLRAGLGETPLAIMQSSGETLAAETAGEQAVRLLLSGPAGGLAGALAVGSSCGESRLLTFDMGGTSTDVALLDGKVRLTGDGYIGRYPVAVPMVDMHTIGAGGGSIARIDDGGMLLVGPESAGASPGPACYGQGGELPTVTDANLILGRLPNSSRLGGHLALDRDAAIAAFEPLASQMQVSVAQAAAAVIALANEHMSAALRVISVQRGEDPRDYALMAFGGAGGLHVCALAQALSMRRAVVPPLAGVLSAYGMLAAAPGRQLSLSVAKPLEQMSDDQIRHKLNDLAKEGRDALLREGVSDERVTVESSVDLRYLGQSSALNVPWLDRSQAEAAFHELHESRFGHRLDHAIELASLRVSVAVPSDPPKLYVQEQAGGREIPVDKQVCVGLDAEVACYQRLGLAVGDCVTGPAIIIETVGTTWLAPGWQATVDESGALLLAAV